MSKKTKQTAADSDEQKNKQTADWDKLHVLIRQLCDAEMAESWKGGGDPDDIPLLEAELQVARLRLQRHIDMMELSYVKED